MLLLDNSERLHKISSRFVRNDTIYTQRVDENTISNVKIWFCVEKKVINLDGRVN